MPAPFNTSVAFSTPFLSEPERSNGFASKNVQEAIEEALGSAIANDRFILLAQYGGQANNGRFIEFFDGIDSDDAPLLFGTADAQVLGISCSTTSVSSNATVGFYDQTADPTYITPLYTFDMTGLKEKIDIGSPLFVVPAGGRLVVKVDSSSIQKPHLQIALSSVI